MLARSEMVCSTRRAVVHECQSGARKRIACLPATPIVSKIGIEERIKAIPDEARPG